MKLSVTLFATDRTLRPDVVAREAEARGFHALYLPEHTHIPVSRLTPAPTGEDELPERYTRTLDPWVALAVAAAATTELRLGTGVALVAQHDPIVLAKQVATLDHLSGGRVVLGAGFGWNREEAEDHGVAWSTRRSLVREKILAMQRLWADEEAMFSGSLVSIQRSWSWPKPLARRVPVLLGGAAGPTIFRHVAEYADGWMPIGGAGLSSALPALREAWAAAGRDPATLQVVTFATIPEPAKLAHYRTLGVSEVVAQLPGHDGASLTRALDRYAAMIRN